MKRCDHTYWLSLCTQGHDVALLESDRLHTLINHIPNPKIQRPSLLVLIGNTEKTLALRTLFGVKRARRYTIRRNAGEIHLHLDPSSIFHGRPILLADGDLPKQSLRAISATTAKCHETTRRPLQRSISRDRMADDIYTHLLFPFADVFCFFSADIGGFRQIARHLAAWLERGHSSTLRKSTYPRVVIVTENITPGAEIEKEARNAFLWMLSEETTKDLFQQISAIDIVALFPNGTMSVDARYRRVKERLMDGLDQIRKNREDTRTLFSATHFAAFFKYACRQFSEAPDEPFDFVKASRVHNHVASDLEEHLSNFLQHIKTSSQLTEFAAPMIASSLFLDSYPPEAHTFEPKTVFNTLYKGVFHQVSKARVIAFEQSKDVILRSGFINIVETHLLRYFQQFTCNDVESAAEIHRSNLVRFRDRWCHIQSSSTCLCCLRRRPQYCLPCGHCICENCVIVFGDGCEDDPWIFKVRHCFLCGQETPSDITVRVHPPTAGVGLLCIDGGGTRGIMPLMLMKRVQDRISLPIPFQRFFKVAFGVSIGAVIAIDHYIKGRPLSESIQIFEKMAELAFKRRKTLNIPFLSRAYELGVSYFADGLYSAQNIEAVLKEAFGTDQSILDCSYATSTGTKIGLPVATVSSHPSYRIFTNYNGVGTRDEDQDNAIIRPKDGFGRVPLWEIARSASAAPGFFPPKYINEVGTFQDAGLIENNPLLWALSEASAMFPLVEEPDFVLSLGTGEPGPKNYEASTDDCRSIRKNGMFPRSRDLILEKLRDKTVRRAYRTGRLAAQILHRIHRLSVDFESTEPRLDDTRSIPELKSMVQTDRSLSTRIDAIARCMIASLFYFELDSDSLPERYDGKYAATGYILCSIRRSDPAFPFLLNKLSNSSARFLLNDWPIPGSLNDPSFCGKDGSFRKRVELETFGKFTISLKEGDAKPCDISGSPFSIDRLVSAQGLDAPFGRADHGKRKRSYECDLPARKRRRI